MSGSTVTLPTIKQQHHSFSVDHAPHHYTQWFVDTKEELPTLQRGWTMAKFSDKHHLTVTTGFLRNGDVANVNGVLHVLKGAVWELADMERDKDNRANQKYPSVGISYRLAPDGTWKPTRSQYWKQEKKRKLSVGDEGERDHKLIKMSSTDDDGVNPPPQSPHAGPSSTPAQPPTLNVLPSIATLDLPHQQPHSLTETHASTTASSSPTRTPVLGNPLNQWLFELLNTWRSFPITMVEPTSRLGLNIISELIQRQEHLPKIPTTGVKFLGEADHLVDESNPSGVAMTLNDLMDVKTPYLNRSNVADYYKGGLQEGISKGVFVSEFMNVISGKPWDNSRKLYAAIDIVLSDDPLVNGVRHLHLKPTPYLEGPEFLFCPAAGLIPGKTEEIGWTTVFTPPGWITPIHEDYHGAGQYMIHLEGKKLWICWPPTEYNISQMMPLRFEPDVENQTVIAIQKLDGLHLLYCENAFEAFILPPGYYHACISFTTCAHTGVRFWELSTFDETFRIFDQVLDFVMQRSQLSKETVQEKFWGEAMNAELPYWLSLAEENPKSPTAKKIKEYIKGLEDRVNPTLKQLGYDVVSFSDLQKALRKEKAKSKVKGTSNKRKSKK